MKHTRKEKGEHYECSNLQRLHFQVSPLTRRHVQNKMVSSKTVISGRGFLGLPQRGISNHKPVSFGELSEPSANSSFESCVEDMRSKSRSYL